MDGYKLKSFFFQNPSPEVRVTSLTQIVNARNIKGTPDAV